VQLTSYVAWLLWGLVHIYLLIGFRNRLAVLVNWMWSWLTYGRGARLITGPLSEP
jgi:NADH dehydrogenase FAD-containing subunit